jgi:two-component system aerobic respiration control sensor histidine kinase ArcB
MRERDLQLNVQLKDNIAQLNQEIGEREKRKPSARPRWNS